MAVSRPSALTAAARGSFHKPDPKPYPLYKYTRRTHMEDVNTVFYSDFAPEFHLHLHSIQIQHSRQGYGLCLWFFGCVIFPMWMGGRWLNQQAGSMMFPSVRPSPDHAHMIASLGYFVKAHNPEKAKDFLGRRDAE